MSRTILKITCFIELDFRSSQDAILSSQTEKVETKSAKIYFQDAIQAFHLNSADHLGPTSHQSLATCPLFEIRQMTTTEAARLAA